MKRLEKLRLNQLSKDALDARTQVALKDGCFCFRDSDYFQRLY